MILKNGLSSRFPRNGVVFTMCNQIAFANLRSSIAPTSPYVVWYHRPHFLILERIVQNGRSQKVAPKVYILVIAYFDSFFNLFFVVVVVDFCSRSNYSGIHYMLSACRPLSLGHTGIVSSIPGCPYLKWSLKYVWSK